jgi:hypothetical protein
MISQSLRIVLLVGLVIASVAAPQSATNVVPSQRQPMPCGPECPP